MILHIIINNHGVSGNHSIDKSNKLIGSICKTLNQVPGIILGRLDINITSGLARAAIFALSLNGLDFIVRNLKLIDGKRESERERDRHV
jgi:hypothetical protein